MVEVVKEAILQGILIIFHHSSLFNTHPQGLTDFYQFYYYRYMECYYHGKYSVFIGERPAELKLNGKAIGKADEMKRTLW